MESLGARWRQRGVYETGCVQVTRPSVQTAGRSSTDLFPEEIVSQLEGDKGEDMQIRRTNMFG